MVFISFLALILSLTTFLLTPSLDAQVSQNFLKKSQPVFEVGAGSIALNTPNYPGAKNNQLRVVPFPYLIYRGRFLRSDDEGTRARLLSSKVYETGISFGFNFPIKSVDNPSRQGMPDLDTLIALGPRFLVRLISDNPRHRLNASIAVRGVFSTNFGSRFRAEGLAFEPALSFWHRFKNSQTTLFSTLAFDFGSAKRNRFLYDVAPAYVTPNRAAYLAKAGLTETSLSLGFGQNFIKNRVFVFGAASWRNFNWTPNIDSPLIESRDNLSLIFGMVWTFYESKERVKRVTNIGL